MDKLGHYAYPECIMSGQDNPASSLLQNGWKTFVMTSIMFGIIGIEKRII